MDSIRISCIYPLSMDIIRISCIYPHFVDIIHILDTIGIGHITSYQAHNVSHVPHIFVMVVDIVVGPIMSYLSCYVHVSFWDSNLSRYGHGGKTYQSRYFPRAGNRPKWVLSTRKNLPPIDGKETFHVDPRIPGYLAEKASQKSSHACQIVASNKATTNHSLN